MEYKKFPKIPRLSRGMVISEKIDGTNAQIVIIKKLDITTDLSGKYVGFPDLILGENSEFYMFAGSKERWLVPGKQSDNYGFAGWVKSHSEELFKLGEGYHAGEWWGNGIGRGYGLTEKRFSLFNTSRWVNQSPVGTVPVYTDTKGNPAPDCISVVPVLYTGDFNTTKIDEVLADLKAHGSYAVPFMNPEGIVIYHVASRSYYKKTLENDQKAKGE